MRVEHNRGQEQKSASPGACPRFCGWRRSLFAIAFLLLLASCEFEPISRPVTPELLLEGDYRIVRILDLESRYIHVQRDPKAKHPRDLILDMRTRESCVLPLGTTPLVTTPLSPPNDTTEPALLWPVAHRQDGQTKLAFADTHCALTPTRFDAAPGNWKINLDHDAGQALLSGDGRGRLRFIDPWHEQSHVIANGVGLFVEAVRSQDAVDSEPQSLWLIEGGELRRRTLDGTLLVTGLGTHVSDFEQGAFASTRLAFVDGGDLYEAVAPSFTAKLVAKDACRPSYISTELSFIAPCSDPQLYRIDLTSGELVRFPKGVTDQWEDSGFVLEYGNDEDGEPAMWATPPRGERTQVSPVLSQVSVLDARTLTGFSPSYDFGVWRSDGSFTVLMRTVRYFVGFPDQHSGRVNWVTLHDVKRGLGQLSVLNELNLGEGAVARRVPEGAITGGYLLQVPEPVLLFVRDAEIIGSGDQASYRGTLEARVLSGELYSVIDEGVSSFELVPSITLGGVLYAIDAGARRGLWFAAL